MQDGPPAADAKPPFIPTSRQLREVDATGIQNHGVERAAEGMLIIRRKCREVSSSSRADLDRPGHLAAEEFSSDRLPGLRLFAFHRRIPLLNGRLIRRGQRFIVVWRSEQGEQ
jgi:hypothetical protein